MLIFRNPHRHIIIKITNEAFLLYVEFANCLVQVILPKSY